jgi:hypothetical protein
VRRNARDALIALGPITVAPMLEAWHQSPSDYKTKLGVVVVINDMLRNDDNSGGDISNKLNQSDIKLLVGAASDNDKTIRLQATELLYTLRDKRVVSDSLDVVRNGSNENAVYNNLLILKAIVPTLDYTEKKRVKDDVMNYVPFDYFRARTLAESIDP